MKRNVALIVLVVIIVASLSVFQGCGKKQDDVEKPPKKPVVTEQKQETQDKPETQQQQQVSKPKPAVNPETAKLYELQVAASPSYANIITEKNKLAQYGYETKITTTKKGGKLFYRLRLKGLYSAPEANDMGKQLVAKFPSINEYWLAKVK